MSSLFRIFGHKKRFTEKVIPEAPQEHQVVTRGGEEDSQVEPLPEENVEPLLVTVNPQREEMIRDRELNILKTEEENLKIEWSKLNTMIEGMEKRHLVQMEVETKKMADLQRNYEEFREASIQKMRPLMEEYDLRKDLIDRTEYGTSKERLKRDIEALKETRAKMDSLEAIYREQDQQFQREIRGFEMFINERRKKDTEVITNMVKTKEELEDKLKNVMTLKKALEERQGLAVILGDEKTMEALDWMVNMKKAVQEMKSNPSVTELKEEEEVDLVHGYKILNQVVRKGFGSVVYRIENPRFHAQIFDFRQQMDDVLLSQLERDGFRILGFIKRNPFRHILNIHDIFMVNIKAIVVQEAIETDLATYVEQNGQLDEGQIRKLAEQLGIAINYLHNIGVAHQNVNPFNAYVDDNGTLKLAGLEFAIIYYSLKKDKVILERCSKYKPEGSYFAPEISLGLEYNPAVTDVFSYGITVIYMFLGDYPYDSQREQSGDEQWAAARQKLESRASKECFDFLRLCVQLDPKDRSPMKELVAHPWFADKL